MVWRPVADEVLDFVDITFFDGRSSTPEFAAVLESIRNQLRVRSIWPDPILADHRVPIRHHQPVRGDVVHGRTRHDRHSQSGSHSMPEPRDAGRSRHCPRKE